MANVHDLGEVTAYAYAVSHGYTGTEAEFAEQMTGAARYAGVAEDSAEDAEAYAIGKRGGVDVPSTDPAYHNNAKYWADSASGANVADVFSTSTAYSVGDYVLYNGTLYRFTAAHAAGAWNASDVTAVKVGGELTDLKDDLSVLELDATGSDIGKSLSVKTVSDGKVTEYEFKDSTLSNQVKQALKRIFSIVAYTVADAETYYDELLEALGILGAITEVDMDSVEIKGYTYKYRKDGSGLTYDVDFAVFYKEAIVPLDNSKSIIYACAHEYYKDANSVEVLPIVLSDNSNNPTAYVRGNTSFIEYRSDDDVTHAVGGAIDIPSGSTIAHICKSVSQSSDFPELKVYLAEKTITIISSTDYAQMTPYNYVYLYSGETAVHGNEDHTGWGSKIINVINRKFLFYKKISTIESGVQQFNALTFLDTNDNVIGSINKSNAQKIDVAEFGGAQNVISGYTVIPEGATKAVATYVNNNNATQTINLSEFIVI